MWPDSFVHVFPDAVPPAVLAGVARDADALAATDNFFVTKERILAGPAACRTPAELAVCLLYHQHVAPHLPPDAAGFAGAEYWVQVYEAGLGLGFHFDKDEHLLKATGEMRHPAWSSILYLTGCAGPGSSGGCSCSGGCDWDGTRLAPTVILQQLFDASQGCPAPDSPQASVLVWPATRQYCLFDGRLGHGVLNSCSSSRRVTLLVNWWSQQPQAVNVLEEDVAERLNLTLLSQGDTASAASMLGHWNGSSRSDGHGNQQQQQQQQQQTEVLGNSPADVASLAVAVHAASIQDGSSTADVAPVSFSKAQGAAAAAAATNNHNSSSSSSSRAKLPVCKVTLRPEEDQGGPSAMQLLDAVLAANELRLEGPAAIHAVAFEHPGFVLCPVEAADAGAAAEQLLAECSSKEERCEHQEVQGNSRTLQTLAAFVAQHMLESSSDSESEGP